MPQKIPGAREQRPRCHFLIVISPSRPTLRWHRGNQPLFLTTSKWELLAMSIWKTTAWFHLVAIGPGLFPDEFPVDDNAVVGFAQDQRVAELDFGPGFAPHDDVGVGLIKGEDFVGALDRALADDAFVGLFYRRR